MNTSIRAKSRETLLCPKPREKSRGLKKYFKFRLWDGTEAESRLD